MYQKLTRLKPFRLPLLVFLFTAILLSFVQLKVDNPMLLLERFVKGGGWIEIALIGFYGALVAFNMQVPAIITGHFQEPLPAYHHLPPCLHHSACPDVTY